MNTIQTHETDAPFIPRRWGRHASADRREYHRERYLANRERILRLAADKREQAKADAGQPQHTEPRLVDPDTFPDTRWPLEQSRRDELEGIRLRLIWASSAGGDEGAVARTAVAVIRFAEAEGGRWTDRALRLLHRRLAIAEGLTTARFERARHALARELFIPL